MTRLHRLAVIIAVALVLGGQAFAMDGKQLTLNLDFFDIAIAPDCWDISDNAGEMDRLMKMAADHGVDRILFRVSICGVVAYHSEVMYTADAKAFEAYEGRTGRVRVAGNMPCYIPRMADVMADIDPLREGVEAAHRYGMECWAWITVWDSKQYAPPEEFFQQHPEYTWVSRDGADHIEGVPCYAYPEVREHRLKQIHEIVDYDVDGIFLSMRSHAPWPHRGEHMDPVEDSGARGYGYNEPVVAEYIRRYGVDPREVPYDSAEALRFVELKGEFFKTWLAEVHEVTQSAGIGLAMNIMPKAADPTTANWLYVPADDIAREGVVDELCILGGAGRDMSHWRSLADGNLKTTTFTSIHSRPPNEAEQSRERFSRGLADMLANPTSDGACFMEFSNVSHFNMWDEIEKATGVQ